MFKMGCSMAKKILAIDGKSTSSADSTQSSSKKSKDKSCASGEPSAKTKTVSADELGDFSKLEQDPRIPLNVRQIFKITKSWKAIARTMSKTGTAMFLNLFEQNKDLFYLFDRFQHLKGEDLHESMELREHAATVMSTLDQSISSLSDYDNFVTYLHSIGKLHRKVPGFKRTHFWKIEQPFLKAVKQTLDERCNETIEEIYKIAIKLIIETIAAGYGEDQDGNDAMDAGDAGGAGANDHQGKAGHTNGGGSSGGGGAANRGNDSNGKPSAASGNNKQPNTNAASDASEIGGAKWKLAKDFDDNEVATTLAPADESDEIGTWLGPSEPNHCTKGFSGNISAASPLGARSSDEMMDRMKRPREPQHNICGRASTSSAPPPLPEAGPELKLKQAAGIILAASGDADGVGPAPLVEMTTTTTTTRTSSGTTESLTMASNAFADDGCAIDEQQDEKERAKETNKEDPISQSQFQTRGTLFALSRLLQPALLGANTARGECPAARQQGRSPLIIEGSRSGQLSGGNGESAIGNGQMLGRAWEEAAAEGESGILINCSQFDSGDGGAADKGGASGPHDWPADSQTQDGSHLTPVTRDERRNLDRGNRHINNCSANCSTQRRGPASDYIASPSSDDSNNSIDKTTSVKIGHRRANQTINHPIFPNDTAAHNSDTHQLATASPKHRTGPSPANPLSCILEKSRKLIKKFARGDKDQNETKTLGYCPRFVANRQTTHSEVVETHKRGKEFSLSSDPGDLIELVKMLMLALSASRDNQTHIIDAVV